MLTITSLRAETPTVTTIIIEGPEITAFAQRRAGQFALLRVQRDGVWSEPHPFTLSGAPEDHFLQMTIKAVGTFTSSVRSLPPNTLVDLKGPLGSFCKDIDSQPEVVLIAGGIGITPFLSVLRHWRNIRAPNRVTLLWANNDMSEIFASDELREMTEVIDLHVVHVIWRPGDHVLPSSRERIVYETGVLTSELFRRHISFGNTAIYLCGSPNMQTFVFPQLEACGVDTTSVAVEKFAWPPRGKSSGAEKARVSG